jgi:hypothetical protein
MIEAAMIWNEPNNKSHWDPEIDPDWSMLATTLTEAAKAIHSVNPAVKRVLGGISPIDPFFIQRLEGYGVLDHLEVIAVHGFRSTGTCGRSTNGRTRSPRSRRWRRTTKSGRRKSASAASGPRKFRSSASSHCRIAGGPVPRVFWYSLFDLPQSWGATTRHREAEGSSYYRHFYMGLIREDGTPKLALEHFAKHSPAMGLMQWFHFEDPRLDSASSGCAGSASPTFAPASAGRTATARAGKAGSTGRWTRSPSSRRR